MKSVYLLLLLNRYCDEKPLFTAVILGHDTEGTDPMGRYIIQVVCVCSSTCYILRDRISRERTCFGVRLD